MGRQNPTRREVNTAGTTTNVAHPADVNVAAAAAPQLGTVASAAATSARSQMHLSMAARASSRRRGHGRTDFISAAEGAAVGILQRTTPPNVAAARAEVRRIIHAANPALSAVDLRRFTDYVMKRALQHGGARRRCVTRRRK